MLSDLKILVLSKDEVAVKKINDFIARCGSPQLALIHSSLHDDEAASLFYRQCVDSISLPFIGLRVSDTLTNEGLFEDAVVVGVLCGDFSVKLGHHEMDIQNSGGMIRDMSSKLVDGEMCFVLFPLVYSHNAWIDAVFRGIQKEHPNMQFIGATSTPEPIVFSNQGVFTSECIFALIDGISSSFHFHSGISYKSYSEAYTVTKSEDYCINQLDGENAVIKYCAHKGIKPYFFNMLLGQVSKPFFVMVMGGLAKANELTFKTIIKSTTEILGRNQRDVVEPLMMIHFDQDSGSILSQSYVPVGTVLRWIRPKPEGLVEAYDRLREETLDAKGVLGFACSYRIFWKNFKTDELVEKAKQFRVPFIISHGFGELGTWIPYDGVSNLQHGGVVLAVGLR